MDHKVIEHLLMNKPVLCRPLLVLLIVHIYLVVVLYIVRHVLNDCSQSHEKAESSLQVFVTYTNGLEVRLSHHLKASGLDCYASSALQHSC